MKLYTNLKNFIVEAKVRWGHGVPVFFKTISSYATILFGICTAILALKQVPGFLNSVWITTLCSHVMVGCAAVTTFTKLTTTVSTDSICNEVAGKEKDTKTIQTTQNQ